MGRRGGTETLARVLIAFLERRTWRQAELAQRAAVERKTLVKLLTDLQHAGLPLTRDEDPPQVYWSVPNTWFPGSVAFQGPDVADLVRMLQRTPRTEKRERILAQMAATGTVTQAIVGSPGIVTQTLTTQEEALLSMLHESTEKCVPLRVRHVTCSLGDVAWRHLSVHRILVDSGRIIATCHRTGQLKWLRLDGILSATFSTQDPYRSARDVDIQRFVNESVDGYHSGGAPIRCSFRVRVPEATWLRGQLPPTWEAEECNGALVFIGLTSGMLPLARLIVGLGAAVTVDTLELRELVTQLARAALEANQ